jgi:hypothetical protein
MEHRLLIRRRLFSWILIVYLFKKEFFGYNSEELIEGANRLSNIV